MFLGWLVNEGWKECRADSDCKSNQYCSSKFDCRDIPVMEKASPGSSSLVGPAAIVGFSLVAAALIMKWETLFGKKKKEKHKEHHAEKEGLYEKELEGHHEEHE